VFEILNSQQRCFAGRDAWSGLLAIALEGAGERQKKEVSVNPNISEAGGVRLPQRKAESGSGKNT